MVRVGRYAGEAAAEQAAKELAARGLPGGTVQHTGEDGHPTTGPWSLDVLVLDPARFRGRLRSELADGIVPGRETTSAMARRTGALAAVNGGYFVIGGPHTAPGNWVAGTDGDPAGISVVDGVLVSEAVNGRPALVVRGEGGRGHLGTPAGDQDHGPRRGRRHPRGDRPEPAARPDHQLRRRRRRHPLLPSGARLHLWQRRRTRRPHRALRHRRAAGPGYQATLDADGRVTAVRGSRGGTVPARGTLLQGTGTGAQWLRAHARTGARLTVRSTVVDADRRTALPVTAETSVVNGGPLLLRDGATVLDPVRDGWSPEDIEGADRAALYNGWYLRRNPRTAAGVTQDGRVVLLTVDGRAPGRSAGLSITETAAVMRGLGAVDALNLDGGGSTAMVVRGALQGVPSDAAGERPAGDALVVLPAPAP
ncbi:hypothetical protein GCM10020295_13450 [Streptomyces cinereospinus]